MTTTPQSQTQEKGPNARRIYPLDDPKLTEEQIAVIFAMTSRSPEPFDEIADQVSREKAADFNEKWVVGYGHASVAEHAVLHLAVENISRLACDTLEDNRLASYTEKSSRYQVIAQGSFHQPKELHQHPALLQQFNDNCNQLFAAYQILLDNTMDHLNHRFPQDPESKETRRARALRLRRIATDSCRALIPAATLTNVGITANARTLEHAISKLMSSTLTEEREIAQELLEQGQRVAPTLIKYAAASPYLERTNADRPEVAAVLPRHQPPVPDPWDWGKVRILEYDTKAIDKLVTALLYRHSPRPYSNLGSRVARLGVEEKVAILTRFLEGRGGHEDPIREFEMVSYLMEFTLDYGAYREFKRHRMHTSLTQDPSPALGYTVPPLIEEAGLAEHFNIALRTSENTFEAIQRELPHVAPYALTHAHHRRLVVNMNLRDCYHMIRLRTSPQAHESIRKPMQEALELLQRVHPPLFASELVYMDPK